jgi:hypothetical protein
MKPIPDKAELSIDFPDKTYMGVFGRESGFDVRFEPEAVLMKLVRQGEQRRVVEFHIHYHLLADILKELANAIEAGTSLDDAHRDQVKSGVAALHAALRQRRRPAG